MDFGVIEEDLSWMTEVQCDKYYPANFSLLGSGRNVNHTQIVASSDHTCEPHRRPEFVVMEAQ